MTSRTVRAVRSPELPIMTQVASVSAGGQATARRPIPHSKVAAVQKMRRFQPPLAVLLSLILMAGSSWGQDLPTGLHLNQDPYESWVTDMRVPTAAPGGNAQCFVAIKNRNRNAIKILWQLAGNGAVPELRVTTEVVSFMPTAATRSTTLSDTIYVAGWSPRTGRVVIEEWKLPHPELGTANPVEQPGPPRTVIIGSLAVVERRQVFLDGSDPALAPVVSMTVDAALGSIYALPNAQPAAIHSVDIETGALTLALDLSSYPNMSTAVALDTWRHSSRGMVLTVANKKPWKKPGSGGAEAAWMIFLEDPEYDGMDFGLVHGPITWSDFHSVMGDGQWDKADPGPP